MNRFLIAASLAAMAPAPAMAQDAPGAPGAYVTAGQIAAARARAVAGVRPGHGTSSQALMTYGPYTAKLEYHTGPNIANAHPGQAELFQALEGSGAMVTGGTIVRSGESSSIVGGTERRIAAGDVFIVPEGMPHWFPRVDGHLVMISVMLPAPAPITAITTK
ncbi:cupin domain-containing protein [Novosphingobium flavum]|uniref:Cupin domain-containing protein n=1 Tax=Novosphingobium flavum TaxID=1778672 RepID=A0A7X1FRB1_9SPHN|nr:cupin domain-containing protein [Novosphingobium flavum]MBC2665540.1 cupin domain-containing protein [Novosphingobium flavum]